MLEFKNIVIQFGDHRVLDEVSFDVRAGEILFIIGKSGVGKSVTLKTIVGLLQPSSGQVWLEGKQITGLKEQEYFEVRRQCGMIFQHAALLDSLNVLDNILFGMRVHEIGSGKEDRLARIEKLLDVVHLDKDVLQRFPSELSFGMQKKVSIVRTLVLEPSYLLFDEPTTAQDPVSTNLINQLIFELSRKLKVTCVVVSHDMHCAIDIADRIVMLEGGKVVAEGKPESLLESDVPVVQQFFHEAKESDYERVAR